MHLQINDEYVGKHHEIRSWEKGGNKSNGNDKKYNNILMT